MTSRDLVLTLIGALNDGHLPQGGEICQPGVAGGGEHLQLRQEAVDPTSLGGEGQKFAIFGPMHLRHLGFWTDLDFLIPNLCPVLHADNLDPIIPS